MASLDPTSRFSSRVDDYVRYRPSYPAEIVPLLARECGLRPQSTIADMGSGTGLLAKRFLDFGCRVIGVEPNGEMRRAGDQFLSRYAKFSSVDAAAEQTGLPEQSVDLVSAGQSFHWFDPTRARDEFARILRPPRPVALVWNERLVAPGFLQGYEDLMLRYGLDYSQIDHRQVAAPRITAFFGHERWQLAQFPNSQEFDLAGVRGRVESSSYAPPRGHPNYEALMTALERLFEAQAIQGCVQFLYQTNVYYGRL